MAKIVVSDITVENVGVPFNNGAITVGARFTTDMASVSASTTGTVTIPSVSVLSAAAANLAIRNAAIDKYAELGGGVIIATDVLIIGGWV